MHMKTEQSHHRAPSIGLFTQVGKRLWRRRLRTQQRRQQTPMGFIAADAYMA
jgi:hypothetical protein